MEYPTRPCIMCGKSFVPTYPAQVTCSDNCKAARVRQVDNAYRRKNYRKHKEYVTKLEQDNERLQNELIDLKKELEMTIRELQVARKEKDQEEIRAALSKRMKTCERMSLRATTLPCGQRESCFKPTRCSECPPMARLEEVLAP